MVFLYCVELKKIIKGNIASVIISNPVKIEIKKERQRMKIKNCQVKNADRIFFLAKP